VTIYAPTLTSLWLLIKHYGLDPAVIFESEDIRLDELTEGGRRLSFPVVDRLYGKAARLSGSPEFGLKVAEFWHPSHMGALGYIWLLSPTLLDALDTCARYIRMLNDNLELQIECGAETVVVELCQRQKSVFPQMREDISLALFLSMCRANAGSEFHPLSVQLRHSEPEDTAPYFDFLQCPIRFNSKKTIITFDREHAERVNLNANEQLRQVNLEIIVKYLDKYDGDSFRARVSAEILRQLPKGGVKREGIAKALHLTPKTLQRKLHSESTSFKELLTETRTELARQYMENSDMSLTEISFLLGFAETSSFSRAYKRWTGESPSSVHG